MPSRVREGARSACPSCPVPAKPDRIGTFTVTSGCIALMLPPHAATSPRRSSRRGKRSVSAGGDRVLLPAQQDGYGSWPTPGAEGLRGRARSLQSITRIVRTVAGAKPANDRASAASEGQGAALPSWSRHLQQVLGDSPRRHVVHHDLRKIGTSGQSTTKSWPSGQGQDRARQARRREDQEGLPRDAVGSSGLGVGHERHGAVLPDSR